ncbi:MAG: STAS domain-containing protein [Alphaproteobacteria bacterium]
MEVTMSSNGPVLLVTIKGRLDGNTSPGLERDLLGRIQAGETTIVMDFADVDYVSSAGLRVMMVAAKRVRAAHGSVVLCAINDNVLEVLRLSGFHTFFRILPSVAEAMTDVTGTS